MGVGAKVEGTSPPESWAATVRSRLCHSPGDRGCLLRSKSKAVPITRAEMVGEREEGLCSLLSTGQRGQTVRAALLSDDNCFRKDVFGVLSIWFLQFFTFYRSQQLMKIVLSGSGPGTFPKRAGGMGRKLRTTSLRA